MSISNQPRVNIFFHYLTRFNWRNKVARVKYFAFILFLIVLTPELQSQDMFIDDFSTGDYSGDQSTGGLMWSSPWMEIGDDGSPNGGKILVNSQEHRFTGKIFGSRQIKRAADLSCAADATLTFTLRSNSQTENADKFRVFFNSTASG
jgi:hypothetical protein